MSKITNFSADQKKVYDLALDLARCDFSQHIDSEKLSKKDLEEHLRYTIKNDLLEGKTLYQAYRRNATVMFEIIEEIVNVTIGEDVLQSDFIDAFVDVKRRDLGDTTAWYHEGGLLTVAKFAGNHWDTNRQAIDLGSEFTLPRHWFYIHVYDELERFLMGVVSMDRLLDKVYKSVNKYIQDNIYAQFQGVASVVPADFVVNGNSEKALGELCDKVMAAGGYGSLTIAGTRGALRQIADIVPSHMFANSQKEAKAGSGSIGEWEGHKLMIIPQTLKSGTYELALNDNQLFVMGADVKPIKLEFYGDTRTKMDTTGQEYNDQSMDFQLQTCMGMGMIIPEYFGCFNFATE